ncbi:MAG: oxygen-insensitive NAD(P)H-dependent nitroreductase NfsB [Pseudomonadota bacterium]|uniref:oxygen-insensitive NAD(P)H-dependent nitroreductase NfsB n=1 Tax=Gallaecimonas pentaromativorans TaxID=584787 RepID=UPI00067F71D2|nr:oxygen-insensitive NAD(P)H-dependent nitroreductase NfsB [Gallaecimonas pentaromativorans]MED5526318.1 oxygen-insensitive NAD(P)H-dependent nitroreductase NfsB [Pseudomonadota bacterium]
MNITDFAKARYSTKAFDPSKTISDDKIAQLKELARFSPSSVNSQPWHLILAATEEGKNRIAKAAQGGYSFNEAKIKNASHVLVFCAKTSIDEHYIEALIATEDADGRYPTEEAKAGGRRGRTFFVNQHRFALKDAQHWMEKQVYLNLGTVLLGAATLDIDAVPIEGFDAQVLDAEFDLHAKGYTSLVIVALGYHSEDDFNKKLPKSRWPLSRIFTEC